MTDLPLPTWPELRCALEPTTTAGRAARCMAVSVFTTVLSAAVLVTLAVGLGAGAAVANVVAVCCGIGPSYWANRRWVWRRSGRSSATRETVPFWTMSLCSLALSTVVVSWTAGLTAEWSAGWRAIALPAANLVVFGTLWVAQFFLLDRVLFRGTTPGAAVRGANGESVSVGGIGDDDGVVGRAVLRPAADRLAG